MIKIMEKGNSGYKKFNFSLITVCLLFLSFCQASGSQKNLSQLNIILIVVDALRADHLGCYGYSRNTSPVIDKLALNAVLCTKAYAQSNWTGTSMASLMSGTYPLIHKIYKPPGDGKDRYSILPKTLEIVPETLHKAGYYASAITSCGYVSPNSGYGKGFDDFQLVDRKDETIVRQTITLLNQKRDSRFFVYMHLLDLHDYFDFNKNFCPFSQRTYSLSDTMQDLHRKSTAEIFNSLQSMNKDSHITTEDVDYLIDRYDGNLKRTDNLIGELINFLRKENILDNTLIIITADHGESFFEHGKLVHGGDSLYNEVLHIPIIIHNKGLFHHQKKIDSLVESIDLYPTILDLLKIGDVKISTLHQLQGKSIFARRRNQIILSELYKEKVKLIFGNWSYIYNIKEGNKELYALDKDPFETRNLSAQYRNVIERIDKRLEQIMSDSLTLNKTINPEDAPIDEDVKEALKSLGYIR